MAIRGELTTICTSLEDISKRLTHLVDQSATLPNDLYSELVAAERTIGALMRRLQRASNRLPASSN
jgi:hypothetical protein